MKNRKNGTTRSLVLFLALATSVMIVGTTHSQAGSLVTANQIDREPLVVFDVSGYGIAGPIHQHLAVYSDGLITLSALNVTGSMTDMIWVTPKRAEELNNQLIAAGALELADRWTEVADLPLTTITVFNGSGPNAVYNVFSFYDINQPRDYQAVVGGVQAFIFEVFFPQP